MIDHLTFGVSDFARSVAFYDKAFAPLGIRRLFDVPKEQSDGVNVTGYGGDHPLIWLADEKATTGLLHIALRADCRADVDAIHAAALGAGGTDNGPPGLRSHYHQDYYAAFVLDPDGHNIEAVCHAPET